MTEEKEVAVPITTTVWPVQVEFIEKAAQAVGESRPQFMREVLIAAAEKALGKTQPECAPLKPGRVSIYASVAAAKGMTVDAYKIWCVEQVTKVGISKPKVKHARKAKAKKV